MKCRKAWLLLNFSTEPICIITNNINYYVEFKNKGQEKPTVNITLMSEAFEAFPFKFRQKMKISTAATSLSPSYLNKTKTKKI